MNYAGLGRRFIALFIDFIVFNILFFPMTRLVKGVWIMSNEEHLWDQGWFITDPMCLTFLAVMVLYFILLEGIFGATIGKKLTGIKVVQANGQKPNMKQAIIRNILRIVDALPVLNILGVALIATSPEKARFGDRVAGTRVIVSA